MWHRGAQDHRRADKSGWRFPLSWSLDSVGPLTRSVEDAALVYQCLRGADPRTPPPTLSHLRMSSQGCTTACVVCASPLLKRCSGDQADAEVAQAVRACGDVLANLGAQVDSLAFPEAAEAQELNPRGLWSRRKLHHPSSPPRSAFEDYHPIVRQRRSRVKTSALPRISPRRAPGRSRVRKSYRRSAMWTRCRQPRPEGRLAGG